MLSASTCYGSRRRMSTWLPEPPWAHSLACLRQGLPAMQARGYDDLSAETLARFEAAHVGAVEPGALRAALAASVLALMRAGAEARLPQADTVAQRLAELR